MGVYGKLIKNDNPELYQYYYHSDHLGSSSYITNLDGEVAQHIEYVPFGEVFLEEKNDKWNTPYLFNGKELDEETGLYYYGARYYDSRVSLWISVDPLAVYNPIFESEHYIDGEHNGGVYNLGNLNVYGYTYQNPIKYVDPNGKQAVPKEVNGEHIVDWKIKVINKDNYYNDKQISSSLSSAGEILSQNGVTYNLIEDKNATFTLIIRQAELEETETGTGYCVGYVDPKYFRNPTTGIANVIAKGQPIAHELGHILGLEHIWEEQFQESQGVDNSINFINNLMNSDENSEFLFQNSKGTELTNEQSNSMWHLIKVEHNYNNKTKNNEQE